jgi:cadmium resistance protein CadD (predicted permease)
MREIKQIVVNILAVTCLVLLLLVLTAIIIDGVSVGSIGERNIQVSVFLQIFAVNTLICVGLHFTHKLETKYAILEFLIDTSFTIIVLLVFSAIFGWFSTREWIIVVMGIMAYLFGLLTNIFRTRQDAKEINELLQKRKEKNKGTAS